MTSRYSKRPDAYQGGQIILSQGSRTRLGIFKMALFGSDLTRSMKGEAKFIAEKVYRWMSPREAITEDRI